MISGKTDSRHKHFGRVELGIQTVRLSRYEVHQRQRSKNMKMNGCIPRYSRRKYYFIETIAASYQGQRECTRKSSLSILADAEP